MADAIGPRPGRRLAVPPGLARRRHTEGGGQGMDELRAASLAAYWRANKVLIGVLLAVWALVSFVFAIFLAEPLYAVRVGSIPASFWWAQQGSMVVFVLLIFAYAWAMDRLDERYDVHEEDLERQVEAARRAAADEAGTP
jgi:putative solute:sodium symporter small subunit